ncbi:MAG: CAP domain-containing protein [Chloroflexota bacterium]|nr:CAP domain-containing protein [Chloroflexota bacterium]
MLYPRLIAVALILSSLALCAGLLLPFGLTAAADTVAAADMLLAQNQMRAAIGAPTIPADPRVVSAAQHHADYSSLNGVGGHYEMVGLPGYTGVTPRDRVAAAGLGATFVSEVAASGSSGTAAVAQLWDAPYHRLGLMHPSAVLTGWGHSDLGGRETTVGDLVYDFSVRPTPYVRSPAAGQGGIPPSWAGGESPSPLPAGTVGPVGYPIMVVYSGGVNVVMRAAEIIAPGGVRLPIWYAPQQLESDYQVIVPQRPLSAGTAYHVRFDITVGGQYVTNEWDFTTAGALAVTAPPPAPVSGGTFHSAFVDQTAYPVLQPGATGSVTVRFKNSGTAGWQRGVPRQQANLGFIGDVSTFSDLGMNVGWPATSRVATTTEATVAPGGVATFTFSVRAPASPGVYQLPLRVVIDGVTWLEDLGVFINVYSDAGFHSRWLSQSASPTLRAGAVSAPLTIAFTNTGSQHWVRGLVAQQANLAVARDDLTFGFLGVSWPSANRVAVQVEADVAPGAVGTFVFQVRAPQIPGIYVLPLRPVIDGLVWMEDQGVYIPITVVP